MHVQAICHTVVCPTGDSGIEILVPFCDREFLSISPRKIWSFATKLLNYVHKCKTSIISEYQIEIPNRSRVMQKLKWVSFENESLKSKISVPHNKGTWAGFRPGPPPTTFTRAFWAPKTPEYVNLPWCCVVLCRYPRLRICPRFAWVKNGWKILTQSLAGASKNTFWPQKPCLKWIVGEIWRNLLLCNFWRSTFCSQ